MEAAGPKDIWAVGWKNSGNGLRSLILHYNGTGWTQRAGVPKVGTGDNVLTDVSVVSNDDVWATGYYVDGTQYKTLTLHYNGRAWSHVPSPNGADGTNILMGVDAISPTNAWAVGFEYRSAPEPLRSLDAALEWLRLDRLPECYLQEQLRKRARCSMLRRRLALRGCGLSAGLGRG